MRNLSSAGFMADCAQPVLIGSYVSLDVPGIGLVQAQVRWQVGPRMGGMFLDPISLGRCEWTAAKDRCSLRAGADGRTRTGTPRGAEDFKSPASTGSATSA